MLKTILNALNRRFIFIDLLMYKIQMFAFSKKLKMQLLKKICQTDLEITFLNTDAGINLVLISAASKTFMHGRSYLIFFLVKNIDQRKIKIKNASEKQNS